MLLKEIVFDLPHVKNNEYIRSLISENIDERKAVRLDHIKNWIPKKLHSEAARIVWQQWLCALWARYIPKAAKRA